MWRTEPNSSITYVGGASTIEIEFVMLVQLLYMIYLYGQTFQVHKLNLFHIFVKVVINYQKGGDWKPMFGFG